MIHIITPYSLDKKLGVAYNEAMRLIPDGDSACLMDYDTQFLTPDFGHILSEYSSLHQNSVLTCYTNRIHPLSPQLLNGSINDDSDIRNHINMAEKQKEKLYQVKQIDIMSGFLMVVPKLIWNKVKFNEELNLLGVDSDYRQKLNAEGVPILLMEGLYIFHTYRIMNGIKDKSHLL